MANPTKKYICVLGDGETNEGSVWEALMFLSQHSLSNILVIIDNNKQESLDCTVNILSIEDLSIKLSGFHFDVTRIDGHCVNTLCQHLFSHLSAPSKLPTILIADTIKGKGVSYGGVPMWHHRKLKDHELSQRCQKSLHHKMRNSFAKQLTLIADIDPDVRLLVGDIGFRIFDEFVERHPDKFLNCGIAEQNMISVAAGMASEGLKVFVYTIIPFLTMRAFEQIRVDVGINKANIVLVGVGAGLAYDKLGPTHHASEDIALMRCISDLNVFVPFDPVSTAQATVDAYNNLVNNPSYIRLSKGGEPTLPQPSFQNGRLNQWNFVEHPVFTIVTHGALANRFTNPSIDDSFYNLIVLSDFSDETHLSLLELLSSNDVSTLNRYLFVEECLQIGSFYQSFVSLIINSCLHLIFFLFVSH